MVAERQLALPADYISAAVQSTDTSGGNADQAAGLFHAPVAPVALLCLDTPVQT